MALNFLHDRVTKLPPGFRFQPTDEELVFHYLFSKVFSYPFPASVIPEIDNFNCAPWDLPGDKEQERYFFCNKEAMCTNSKTYKAGHWKAIMGIDKQLFSSTRNDLMGMKRTLVYHRGKTPKGTKTDWIMHEYSLATLESEVCDSHTNRFQDSLIWMNNWVVCRIFHKKRNTKLDYEIAQARCEAGFKNAEIAQPRYYNYMQQDNATISSVSSSSSSEFSCLSDITSNGPAYDVTRFW